MRRKIAKGRPCASLGWKTRLAIDAEAKTETENAMDRESPLEALAIGFRLWQLGVEASIVIGLRSWKIASGGSGAGAEASRMVTEKWLALVEANTRLLTGGYGSSPHGVADALLRLYGGKVRANRRRLTRR
ncbi:hypothetical protein P6144_16225 [Sphingomonas sp. HITSZ_GF]|uniref:hypothetical protein n=1 Tax=Sphingomonas sp. HITSZ_GF TaxID=3037247 RepID=UPI00240D8CC5|nr:hypothetical protein [Sphingomonas sp. HITSZ_GF]MDG2535208.1 hypothetical protein [Sphingomonas sp. HITSZ_GF]